MTRRMTQPLQSQGLVLIDACEVRPLQEPPATETKTAAVHPQGDPDRPFCTSWLHPLLRPKPAVQASISACLIVTKDEEVVSTASAETPAAPASAVKPAAPAAAAAATATATATAAAVDSHVIPQGVGDVELQSRGSKVGRCGSGRPRLLVCHDLMGGYGSDALVQGSGDPHDFRCVRQRCAPCSNDGPDLRTTFRTACASVTIQFGSRRQRSIPWKRSHTSIFWIWR